MDVGLNEYQYCCHFCGNDVIHRFSRHGQFNGICTTITECAFYRESIGKSVRPPNGPNISTTATGKAIFTVTSAGNTMLYTVNASKINHVDNVILLLYTRGQGHSPSDVALLRHGPQHGARDKWFIGTGQHHII